MKSKIDSSFTSQDDPGYGAGINAPMLDEKTLEPQLRSLKDGAQAYSVASALEVANQTRNNKNAVIWRKFNGDPPYNQKALTDAGEGWRSNASFGFLSGIVSRVVPAPVAIVDSARYLTNASLKGKGEDNVKKNEAFRAKVTKAIRQWEGWKSFNYALAQENCLMGGALVAWLDDYSPWPRFFQLDQAFVPDGTLQHARSVQLFVARQEWLIHEAVEFIAVGKKEAEAAGWDVDAMVESINDAMPKNLQGDTASNQARIYEDAIREGNIGISHSTSAKVISVYQILAVETDGKVTQYIVDRRGKHSTLFQKDDRYEDMTQCLTMFTLEPGNGKFYGSKGIGRMIVNQHITIERARNLMIDNLVLSGLPILQAEASKAPQLQVKVNHPFIVTTTDAIFADKQISSNVEEFLQLDDQITKLAEISAGAYIPTKLAQDGSGDKTATEASIDANRENQAKIAFLARYWGQFADLISTMQKRLCDPSTQFPASKELQKSLMEDDGLTEEEIKELANCPAAEVVQDMTQVQNSQKVQVFEALKGDPMINQQALYQMGITAMSTPEIADEVLIPEMFDQSVEAEAVRLQLLESAAMQIGESINVSPRDLHPIHLNVIAGQLKQAWPGIQAADPRTQPKLLDNVNAAMVHGQAHMDAWAKTGGKPGDIAPFKKALALLEKGIQDLAQKLDERKQQQAMMAQQMPQGQPTDPSQQPPQDPNQPEMAPPPDAGMSEKICVAWITQYDKLQPPEKKALEIAGGLANIEASMPPPPPNPAVGNLVKSVGNMVQSPPPTAIPQQGIASQPPGQQTSPPSPLAPQVSQ